MVEVTYTIVEHDGGWAYKLGDVFSETFRTRRVAEEAATRVAAEQRVPGETETIEWEDEHGDWHEEIASGSDRPDVRVDNPFSAPDSRPFSSPTLPPPRDAGNPLLVSLLLAGAAGVLLATLVGRSRSRPSS